MRTASATPRRLHPQPPNIITYFQRPRGARPLKDVMTSGWAVGPNKRASCARPYLIWTLAPRCGAAAANRRGDLNMRARPPLIPLAHSNFFSYLCTMLTDTQWIIFAALVYIGAIIFDRIFHRRW